MDSKVSSFVADASAQPFNAAALVTFTFETPHGVLGFSVTPEVAAKVAVQISSAILKLEDGASAL
jgi:hypothetical protein